jgi:hypothetical protein
MIGDRGAAAAPANNSETSLRLTRRPGTSVCVHADPSSPGARQQSFELGTQPWQVGTPAAHTRW